WSNQGTITAAASLVSLRGQFTRPGLGDFRRDAASTVTLDSGGTLTGDLTLDDTTGSFLLSGGEIRYGHVRTAGSAALVATNQGGTLRGVTLDGTLSLPRSTSGATAFTIEEGFTLNSTLPVGGTDASGNYAASVFIRGSQAIGGTG